MTSRQAKSPAEYALEHAINWWAVVHALTESSDGRGVTFGSDYEPSWLKEAQEALKIAAMGRL